MFWIYVPPVILVGAIIAIVVVLGRKSAELKKIKGFYEDQQGKNLPAGGRDRLKRLGQRTLHILEKILISLKFAVKKSEQSITRLVFNIRAKRAGRKPLKDSEIEDLIRDREGEPETSERKARVISEIKKRENATGNVFAIQETEWVASEVVVKKKRAEEPIVRLKEAPASEDKVKEEALIHRIAENPKDMEAYRELGDYYMSIGNIKDAKDSFKMVLKLRPRDLKAKSSLREIEMKMRLGS